jgi:hypothetical protein
MSDRLKSADQFKNLFSLAKELLQGIALLPFACGYVTSEWSKGNRFEVHDHDNRLTVWPHLGSFGV